MDSVYSESPVVTRLLWALAGAFVFGAFGFMVGIQADAIARFAGIGAASGAVVGLAFGPAARGLLRWVFDLAAHWW